MKNKMLMMLLLLLLGFVFPSAALASDKLFLFEDIGTDKASFSFETDTNDGVAFTARVKNECWDQDCEPYRFYRKSLPKGFSIQNLEVYYNGNGVPMHCGNVQGTFQPSQILSACEVRISPDPVCMVRNSGDNCDRSNSKYRVYMTIESIDIPRSLNGKAASDPS